MIFLFPSEEREKIGRPLLFLSKTFFFWKFFLIPWIIFWSSKNNKNQTFKTFRKFYRKKRISPAGGCFCQPQSRSCKNDLVHLIEYDANATLISKKDGLFSCEGEVLSSLQSRENIFFCKYFNFSFFPLRNLENNRITRGFYLPESVEEMWVMILIEIMT